VGSIRRKQVATKRCSTRVDSFLLAIVRLDGKKIGRDIHSLAYRVSAIRVSNIWEGSDITSKYLTMVKVIDRGTNFS
jgi:hypothetical protein